MLRRRVDGAGPDRARDVLGRIAALYEIEVGSPADAIATHLEVLDHVPDDPGTLATLARLYRAGGRSADLLEIQERRLDAAPPDAEAVELLAELARLLEGPLAQPAAALERWADLLVRAPDDAVALAAVERALDDDERRARATEILRPLYESAGAEAKLERLAVRLAEVADEPREQALRWREAAQRRERALGDRAGALDADQRALRAAVAEPELLELLAAVERLAAALGREDELIDLYRDLAPEVLDAEIQRRLLLDVADLARGVRGDVALARDHYQRVLDAQPDDRRAMLALESIYRDDTGAVVAGEERRLFEILQRKAELSWASPEERTAALVEAAGLAEGALARPDDAIAAWEIVLDAEPQRRDAGLALERLYRGQQRSADLVELYERRLGFAASVEEAVALRLKLAELQAQELRDPAGALESYAAALSGAPDQPVALAAVEAMLDDPEVRAGAAEVLEPLYVARQRWPQLVRVYEVKLEAATEVDERLRLTRYVARLYEEQLEDFEGASRWYARLFREQPADASVRELLGRLANIVENWAFLAEVYQAYLDDEPADLPEVRDVAIAAGALYDRRLGDLARAQLAYRRALGIPPTRPEFGVPDEAEVLRRLEDVLTRAREFATLVDVYDEVIGRSANDVVRRDLTARKARVLEGSLADPPRAIDAWRDLVGLSGDGADARAQAAYLDAVTELERLHRAGGQWFEVVELLQARLDRGPDETQEIELRLRLAAVLEEQQHDVPAAIDQLERVLARPHGVDRALPTLERLVVLESHRQRIVELLEPVYRTRDWWQKLVVILDARLVYVDDAAARVATLREIARIHERRGGDRTLAREALSRAWREDVADAEVLRELAQLAGGQGAWDELIEILEGGVATTYDPELVAAIWARIAEIHEGRRDDVPRAIDAWRKVVEAEPEAAVALAALDRLLALAGRSAELVEIIERRAELATDAGIRLVLLHRAAALYEEVLARPIEAIGAYRRVLELDEADLAALDGLERIYAGPGPGADAHELAGVLARKIELATAPADRRALRLALAKVHEEARQDDYEAVAQLVAVLEEHPRDVEALDGLQRLYRRMQQWPELLDVIDRRSLLAVIARDRADLAFAAAQLVEHEARRRRRGCRAAGAVLQIVSGARRSARRAVGAGGRRGYCQAATTLLEQVLRAGAAPASLARLPSCNWRRPASTRPY
ncbi:MAG: hypothetical protein R2939_14100 [Kofleriaceae bacterium]